ncbi:MAG: hypothetical protein M1839_004629 [Geoglossum umbratile]|nr:MAG: hypothetical protein M1839_004629 [Geoglossum umbratile]
MADCFVQEAPLSWKDNKHKELIGYDRVGNTKNRKQHADSAPPTEMPSRDKKKQRRHSDKRYSEKSSFQHDKRQLQDDTPNDTKYAEAVSRTEKSGSDGSSMEKQQDNWKGKSK